MAEALSTSGGPVPGRVRFARVTAGAAFAFSVVGLAYGQFALVAAAAVCALVGLAAAAAGRDIYAGAGSLVAGVIAITSPTMARTFESMQAGRLASQQAEEARVTSAIAEVEAFDTHMRGFQPDLAGVDQHMAIYARVTQALTLGRGRLLYARSVNSPDQAAIYNQLTTIANQADLAHSQIVADRNIGNQKLAAIPGTWSHIQSLCGAPKVRDADACARVRVDYPAYRERVTQAFRASDRDEAAYAVERPKQQAIMDGLL